jgi:hypothetical protein
MLLTAYGCERGCARDIFIKLCGFIHNFHTTDYSIIYCLNILNRHNLEPVRVSRVLSFLQVLDLQKCALTMTFMSLMLCEYNF